jgi:ABC-type transport system substrate-binding protein
LLAKAGCPDGFKCTIVGGGTREKRMLWEAIQSNLAKVGIEVEIKFVDFREMLKYRLKGGLPTNSLLEKHVLVKAEFAVLLMEEYFSASRWMPELARPEGLDDLLLKAISAESTEEKVKATQAVVKKLYDDVTVIPLQMSVLNAAFQPAVRNIEGYGSIDLDHSWQLSEMWLKQK